MMHQGHLCSITIPDQPAPVLPAVASASPAASDAQKNGSCCHTVANLKVQCPKIQPSLWLPYAKIPGVCFPFKSVNAGPTQ